MTLPPQKSAVIIPCHKVGDRVLNVIQNIPDIINFIVLVDDHCPENVGASVKAKIDDPRLHIIRLHKNHGVGGAVLHGMWYARDLGATVLVKLDGDGQHDPLLLPYLLAPLKAGEADYVKGNRFFSIDFLVEMPLTRKLGNAALSFLTKLSSGYWSVMDPTNGLVALHTRTLEYLPLDKLARRYEFESDMLFRLGTLRAKVVQIPMRAKYGDVISGFRSRSLILPLATWHIRSLMKRYFYTYLLRGFSVSSLYLPLGILTLTSGVVYGVTAWAHYGNSMDGAPIGVVVFIALLIMVGLNSLMAFFAHDMASEPNYPVHALLPALVVEYSQLFSGYDLISGNPSADETHTKRSA